ncbi:ABC transporter substrate-binding protein [Kribbella sp. NPDC049174]|uniref:ABC transporter substrate-binding protein n=1 Tax=Kribbella sp. NPDC049174 TaxID=3364112 RepID=UPI003715031A
MSTASAPAHRRNRRSRRRWTALALAPLLAVAAGCGAAAPQSSGQAGSTTESGKLVVWDWHSGDAKTKEYYAKAKSDFEAKHPGVQVEFVAQPYDQYYTLLGTAIQAGKGPDIAMFNGGAQLRERVTSLLPLDDKTGDLKDRLVGWDAFKNAGTTYAVPITLQGFPFYYNKAVYKKAGLDPETPPKTLAELEAGCAAIKKSGNACFNLGNKEGIGIEFFLSGFAPGVFSPAQYDAWLAGKRDWKSPEVKQIFDLWKKSNDEGWYNKGVNSTAMFMDQFTMFSGGKGGNVIGLISDTAHWKDFDEFLGADLGVYKPPVLNPANVSSTFLPAEGGIGYGVMKWAKSPDLAVDLIKSLAGTDAEKLFFDKAGAIAADKTVDTSSVEVKSAGEIVSWLPESKPLLHTALSAKTLDLMHRLSQQLISGDVTVDAALTQLAASDK